VINVQITATIKDPLNTVPKCLVIVAINANIKLFLGASSIFSPPLLLEKNQTHIVNIVVNCSIAITKANYHYIIKISTHINKTVWPPLNAALNTPNVLSIPHTCALPPIDPPNPEATNTVFTLLKSI